MRSGRSRVASNWIPDRCCRSSVRDDDHLRAGFFFLVVRFFFVTTFFLTAFVLTGLRLRGVLVAAFARFTSPALGGRGDWSVTGSAMRLFSRSVFWPTVLGVLGAGMLRVPFASTRRRPPLAAAIE